MNPREWIVVWVARLATIAMLSVAVPTSACLNTFQSRILHGTDEQIASAVSNLEAAFKNDPTLEHGNDLAVARVMTHRYGEAVVLLEDIERRFPGKAIVAANLGTAFELKGDDAEALRWIREGVKRDSKEHFGSEWLHVLILEAKQQIAADPSWLDSHSVMGVDFGTELVPLPRSAMPADEHGVPRSVRDVSSSLLYQLYERRQFVKPPDGIVADLYATLGDLAYANILRAGQQGSSFRFMDPTSPYEDALEYGSNRAALVKRRLDEVNRIFREQAATPAADANPLNPSSPYLLEERWSEPPLLAPGLIICGILVGVGGAWWWRRQSRIRRP